MAGPWFTVQQSGSPWKTLDTIWLSNGSKDGPAKVQIRMELEPRAETHASL
ncbi:MAG: hypothetical protein KC503_11780 [Myxococcales bacterium]|nr:hypothetical protein [Myxococcales bacterium]